MVPIGEIKVGTRHRKDYGDIAGLAASIEEVGLLHPVVVTPAKELIAGARRLKATESLGWDRVPVTVVDISKIVLGEYAENTFRKSFQLSEMDAIRKKVFPVERVAAKERLKIGGRPSKTGEKRSGKLPDLFAGRAKEKVSKATGVSRRTLDKIAEVMAAAEAEPEKFGFLVAEMDRTGKVNGVYKKLKTMRTAEAIKAEPKPLPTGPFRVIVVDPPWSYDSRAEDPSHRAANPYPSMSIDAIKAMPVGSLGAEDSILWLWTTNAHMPEAFGVLRDWGFTFKTILTWVKDRMGTGDWLRGRTEHCLLAVKGRPTVLLTKQTTVIEGPLRQHSRKPDEFYNLVESLCPGSKVELFSRTQRDGWESFWGEVGLFPGVGGVEDGGDGSGHG
jgi:N6-adenosine-specific RNA methylase IME4